MGSPVRKFPVNVALTLTKPRTLSQPFRWVYEIAMLYSAGCLIKSVMSNKTRASFGCFSCPNKITIYIYAARLF